ncbi:MAG: pseudouridine synthase [Propioniciclava sp.]|uniref:pseudouridine synthase n=1 Tax=Propioniciclava sp. TaxID=2038686 RepID=UPI0039E26290
MNDRPAAHDPNSEGIRLQKVLAQAGIASRRAAEIMIEEGRIEVNGKLVTEQGRRVDPERDVIRIDGSRLPPPRRHVYAMMNKPRGVVSTMDDPEGRPTITDYLGRYTRERVYHVGRLDTDTEGMLLLTNDGDFAQAMMHPRYELPKTYVAEVEGHIDAATLNRLRKGVRLEDGWVNPERVKLGPRTEKRSMVTIVLHEGRNRIVRRLFAAVGHPVRSLSRVQMGPVKMGQLRVGEVRDLTRDELGALMDAVGL